MIIYLSKTNKDLIQIFPVPTDLDNWVTHETEEGQDYSNLEAVEVDGVWMVREKQPEPEPEVTVQDVVPQFTEEIDNTAYTIQDKWTRFMEEYRLREEAAKAYQEAGFEGEPSVYITSFAEAAHLDNKTATLLILKQAQTLWSSLEKLAGLRMRKYELQRATSVEEATAIKDDIVNKMNELAEVQT
ncbi:hypothetical protein [Basilea psittacipulmonis]|uniref:Uncharacterized protein n=1 Tax=Basilea psittacipulmonis DSM 24701 TaxID=1072685 RepID=A0A077DEE7_9BURK|nr:hypothetical protein [Basilea psittacipulmonis]AIL33094.1 hypothetical protein IX83_07035 [Basilea psittacipulmonis DSM 24701]